MNYNYDQLPTTNSREGASTSYNHHQSSQGATIPPHVSANIINNIRAQINAGGIPVAGEDSNEDAAMGTVIGNPAMGTAIDHTAMRAGEAEPEEERGAHSLIKSIISFSTIKYFAATSLSYTYSSLKPLVYSYSGVLPALDILGAESMINYVDSNIVSYLQDNMGGTSYASVIGGISLIAISKISLLKLAPHIYDTASNITPHFTECVSFAHNNPLKFVALLISKKALYEEARNTMLKDMLSTKDTVYENINCYVEKIQEIFYEKDILEESTEGM
ncbi:MAG: hypothetical protein ACI8ZF_000077 [Candidatus Midichloriaceae bacterium]|jgi:hypothetical protein